MDSDYRLRFLQRTQQHLLLLDEVIAHRCRLCSSPDVTDAFTRRDADGVLRYTHAHTECQADEYHQQAATVRRELDRERATASKCVVCKGAREIRHLDMAGNKLVTTPCTRCAGTGKSA